MHKLKSKVSSITQLKASLIDEFKDEVPNTLDFDLGWFEGSSKKWLVVPEDLNRMYCKNEISLWCDVSVGKGPTGERKSGESSGSRRQDSVDAIYQELLTQHSDDYSKPQLRLWARMVHCGTHDDYNEPPKVPHITGTAPKCQKKDTLSDAFTDAARAVAKVFSSPMSPSVSAGTSASLMVGISPGKTGAASKKFRDTVC